MSYVSQFARWLGRRGQHRPHTPTRRVRLRPTLEALETRDLLSTAIIITVPSGPTPPPPPPTTLTVTNLSDTGVSGDGSLRGEIAAANSGDRIVFADSLAGRTITLNPANGPLYLDKDLTIQGPGADKLTISGDNATEVFWITGPASSSSATATITGLTITDGNSNVATGAVGSGILNQGTLTLDHCTLTGNHAGTWAFSGGGAIDNDGTLTVSNSTLSGNDADGSAYGGGGIANFGTLTVSNSTLSGNTAIYGGGEGGGIYNNTGSVLTITSSTIAGNAAGTGGGIANLYGGTLAVRNTIVAGNSATSGPDLAGDLGSQGHNLVGNTAGGSGFAASDLLNVNPRLGPLQDNGGPTQTMALLPGSPAINAGDNTGAPAYDQRGPGFPRIINGIIDIGAFEVQNDGLALAGFPSVITAGNAGSFTVTALNADGTTDTGYTGTVHFTSSDGQAVLPADYTFTAADAGVHTFSDTLKTAGMESITATGTTTGGFTSGAFAVSVSPAAASTFQVSGFPSPASTGVAGRFTVTALDPFGNIASGYGGTVHFTSSDGQASLPADSTLTDGTGTFNATLNTAGTQTLTATDPSNAGLTGTQGGILVHPAVTTLVVAGFPSSTTAGVAQAFTVTALDANGDVATWYTGTVHFTSRDGSATLPGITTTVTTNGGIVSITVSDTGYTFTAADRGVHTFTAILRTAGTQSITVSDPASPGLSGTEGSILVNPAAASQFVLSAPSTVKSGVPFSLTLTVEDAYGNVVTGYTGTVLFSSTDTRASLPNTYTFTVGDKGMHTFTGLVLRKRGHQTVRITDPLKGSLTASRTLDVL